MMYKMLIVFAVMMSVAASEGRGKEFQLPRARVTARVVSELGSPLEGVNVKFIFGASDNANTIVKCEGITGTNGLFSGEGYSGGSYGVEITKDGYYASGLSAPKLMEIEDRHWQPWDPTVTTVLRAIHNPVPMYAKCVQTYLPLADQACGYDLEKGDWVVPYGIGMSSDLIFTVHQEFNGDFNYDIQATVTFSGVRDGLRQAPIPAIAMSSVFKWERFAPDTGFESSLNIRTACFPAYSGKQPIRTFKGKDEWQGYFFRVRSVDQDGKIVKAQYGKIRGDIAIFPPSRSGKSIIRFTYYLNPEPLDRNMEWDVKRNLIADLSWDENPREP